MTIKKIMEKEGVSNYLVIKAVKLLYPNLSLSGRRLDFSEKEVNSIGKRLAILKKETRGRRAK